MQLRNAGGSGFVFGEDDTAIVPKLGLVHHQQGEVVIKVVFVLVMQNDLPVLVQLFQ